MPWLEGQRSTPRLGSASIAHQLLAVTHDRALLFLLRARHRHNAHRFAVTSQVALQVV
jgi:hypothetical protein